MQRIMWNRVVSEHKSAYKPQSPFKFKATRWSDDALQLICTFLTTSEHIVDFARCCKHWQHCAKQTGAWNGVCFKHPGMELNSRRGLPLLPLLIQEWGLQRISGFVSSYPGVFRIGEISGLKTLSNTLTHLDLNADNLGGDYRGVVFYSELKYVLDELINLRTLRLNDMSFSPSGKIASTETATPDWLNCLPRSLRFLSLRRTGGCWPAGTLAKQCPNLIELDLRGSYLRTTIPGTKEFHTETVTCSELAQMPNLTKLDISGTSWLRWLHGTLVDSPTDIFTHVLDLDLSNCHLHYCSGDNLPIGANFDPSSSPFRWTVLIPLTLRRLVVASNDIRSLNWLCADSALEEVDVSYNPLGTDCLVSDELFLPRQLRSITITGTKVQEWEIVQFHVERARKFAKTTIRIIKEDYDPMRSVGPTPGAWNEGDYAKVEQSSIDAHVKKLLEAGTSSESSGSDTDSEAESWTGDESEASDSETESESPSPSPPAKKKSTPKTKPQKRKVPQARVQARKRRKVVRRRRRAK